MKKALFKTMALVVVFVLAFSLTGFTALAEDSDTVDGIAVLNESPAPSESPAPTKSAQPSESPAPTKSEPSPAPTKSAQPSESPAPTESAQPSESPAPTESAQPSESPAPTESAQPSESPAPEESVQPGQQLLGLKTTGTYTLTYIGNGNTGGSPPAKEHHAGSDTVTLPGPGTMFKDGYQFNGWNTCQDGSGTNYQPGRPYVMPWYNTELYAQWACLSFRVENTDPGSGPDMGSGTLDVSYNGSFVTNLGPGESVNIPFVPGVDVVECKGIAHPGSVFWKWNETGDPVTQNPHNFIIPTAGSTTTVQVHPHWKKVIAFTIDTSVVHGTIDPVDPLVNKGYDQTITYIPDTGCHLVSAEVDGVDVGDMFPLSYTFTNVQYNHTLDVKFEPDTFTIYTTAVNGNIDPANPKVSYGSDKTVTYSADTGYHLESVVVDGTDVTEAHPESYTFTDVQDDHTIEVVYAINTLHHRYNGHQRHH